MKGQDRFLIGIVVGMVLLVVAVLLVALLGGDRVAYRPDDSPEAAAYNYLLALRQQDYARAYGYLSPTLAHYPASLDQFVYDVRRDSWSLTELQGDVSLAVESVIPAETQTTVVIAQTTYPTGGLFDSVQYRSTFDVVLREEGGSWKIVQAQRYWYHCWSTTEEPCDQVLYPPKG